MSKILKLIFVRSWTASRLFHYMNSTGFPKFWNSNFRILWENLFESNTQAIQIACFGQQKISFIADLFVRRVGLEPTMP